MSDSSAFVVGRFLSALRQLRHEAEGILQSHGFVPVTPESIRHDSFEFVFCRSDWNAERFVRITLLPWRLPSPQTLRGHSPTSPLKAVLEIRAGVERERRINETRIAVWRVDLKGDLEDRFYTFWKKFEPALSNAIEVVRAEPFGVDPDRFQGSERR